MRVFIGSFCVVVCMFLTSRTQAAVYDEFQGTRSTAMGGAHRGLGTSNDTIYLNPAGMAISRRFSLDLNYQHTAVDKLSHINLSAVDSKSGPVAGAFAYSHDRGDSDGVDANIHRFYVGTAYLVSDVMALGIVAKTMRGSFVDSRQRDRDVNIYTADAGVMAAPSESLRFGASINNIFASKIGKLTPRTVGFGASLELMSFQISADAAVDLRQKDNAKWSFGVGAEYFAGNAFPLRIGYRHQPFMDENRQERKENIISGGAGWVGKTGAVEMTYAHSFTREENWTLLGGIKMFL